MKINFEKIARYAILLVVAVLTIGASLLPEVAAMTLSGEAGVILGATSSSTLVRGADTYEAANDVSHGHLKRDISEKVTHIKPDQYPIDTLIRKYGENEKASNIKVEFEEVQYRQHEAALTAAFTATGGSAQGDKYVDITVDNTNMFKQGETLIVPSVQVSGRDLILRIDEIKDSNTLNVVALNTAGNVVPSIADEAKVYRSGDGHTELAAQADSIVIYPGQNFNYCQRFLCQIEESYIRKNTPAYSKYGRQQQNMLSLYDFRTGMEKSHLFGVKAMVPSLKNNQEPVYYAEGVYSSMQQDLNYSLTTGITWATISDWAKDLFSNDAGSSDRFLYGGKNLINRFSKIDNIVKQLEAKETEFVGGLKMKYFETPFGNVYLYHHKLFDLMGKPNEGVVLDMTNIRKRTYSSMETRPLKLRESGVKNVDAVLIEEIACLEIRYADTHARVRATA
jgi:hypothetical protein